MIVSEKIQTIFPQVIDIPEHLLKDIPCTQTAYLINGELRVWDGPFQQVFSPVWVTNNTDLEPFFIGEYPLLTEAHALEALEQGAGIVNTSGSATCGSFFFPAILYPVNPKMRVYYEEQFGPVIPVLSFKNISEPVDHMIHSSYGQQVSLFSTDPDQIASLIDPLVNQVCRVNINSQCQRGPDTFPFTGRKDSAEGTLSISDALRVFSIRTLVAARQTDLNKQIITGIVRDHKSKFLATDFIL